MIKFECPCGEGFLGDRHHCKQPIGVRSPSPDAAPKPDSEAPKCECNWHLGMGPNLKCPVHQGRNYIRPVSVTEGAVTPPGEAERLARILESGTGWQVDRDASAALLRSQARELEAKTGLILRWAVTGERLEAQVAELSRQLQEARRQLVESDNWWQEQRAALRTENERLRHQLSASEYIEGGEPT